MNFKPLYLGEISKVITSGGTGAASDTRDIPEEEQYKIAEERKKLKTDIDLVIKYIIDISKNRSTLIKARSQLEVTSRRLGFDYERLRFPEIFDRLA